jgi:hypothetical protein
MKKLRGRMSVFGGPNDHGVGPREGLALMTKKDLKTFSKLFLAKQPRGTTGLARRLDPKKFYIACRWNYKETPPKWLRSIQVDVSANGKTFKAQPVDWGPNARTRRVADLSPGLAKALGLETNNICVVVIPSKDHGGEETKTKSSGGMKWPKQSQTVKVYGNPRQKGWLHKNTVEVEVPWKLRGDASHILIHKKVASSLKRVLSGIWDACDHSQSKINKNHYDRFDGSYNLRNIRHGSSLSMHAFAVAIDFDADNNEQGSRKNFFTADSIIVEQFRKEGWEWGGQWSLPSKDAMHFQAART